MSSRTDNKSHTENDQRIPVLVITGFLGAGKTTLVNRILTTDTGCTYAVLVNEFGDVGIDGELIQSADEDLIELNNGCICCVLRGDLIVSLRDLLRSRSDLDGIIIETTGIADPSPVIQTFFADQTLQAMARLESVTCVVDAVNIEDRLNDNSQVERQIAAADQIIINKSTAATTKQLNRVEDLIRKVNRLCPIQNTDQCIVSVENLLESRGFDLENIPNWLSTDGSRNSKDSKCGHIDDERHNDDHTHIDNDGISTLSLTSDNGFNEAKLEQWMESLLAEQGQNILRTKGIINIEGDNRKLAFQSVNMLLEGNYIHDWTENEARTSRIVFIGKELDLSQLQSGFEQCSVN